MTLFGRKAPQDRFFFNLKRSLSLYETYIESLWGERKACDGKTRQEWFSWAQRRWKDLTDREKEEFAAREQKRVATAAETGSNTSSVRAELSGYFTVRDQPSVENGQGSASSFAAASSESTNMKDQDQGQGKQATSCSDGAADSDKPKSLLAAQRRSAMLAELGTNASLLLTPDVLGRGDFLAVLDAAVEAWTKHKQLLAVYDRQKKWSWKQGSIKHHDKRHLA